MSETLITPTTGTDKGFDAEVLQFLQPNGRKRETSTMLPVECESAYIEMLDAGCRFEAEVLNTGIVSVTISDPVKQLDIDISLTRNGPDVQAGMKEMLERGMWKKRRKPKEGKRT